MKYEEIIECQFSTMKDKELHFHQEPEIIYLMDGELTVSGENIRVRRSADRKYIHQL